MNSEVVWVDSEATDTWFKKELRAFCGREKMKFTGFHNVESKLINKILNTKFECITIIVDNKISRMFFQKVNEIILKMTAMLKVIVFVCKALKEVEEKASDLEQYPFFNSKLVFDSVFNIEKELKCPKIIPPKPSNKDKITYDPNCFVFEFIKSPEDLKLPLYYNKILSSTNNKEIVDFTKYLKQKFSNKDQINHLLDQILYIKSELPIEILVKYWLRMYTAESTFYRDMNATLMARKDKSFDTYIKVCYEGLKKKALKIFNNDQLFRGTVLSNKEIEQIQESLKQKKKDLPNCICYCKSFLSCSKEVRVAKRFMSSNPPLGTSNVLFEIEKSKDIDKDNPSNANITPYSFYKEEEIVFFPFSSFEVNEITSKKEGSTEYYLIKLSYLGKYKDIIPEDLTKIPDSELAKDLIQSDVIDKKKIKDDTFDFDTRKYTDPNYKEPEKPKIEKEKQPEIPKAKKEEKKIPQPEQKKKENKKPEVKKVEPPKIEVKKEEPPKEEKKENEENKGIFDAYKDVPEEWKKNSILAQYLITEDIVNTKFRIFDKNGNNNSNSCDIYFEDKKIDFTFEYSFSSTGAFAFRFFFKTLLTNISSMFEKCTSLVQIDLSSFNASKVEHMNNMFYGCKILETIDFTDFNTQSATDMSGMFRDCPNLKNLNLSSFNTVNVFFMSSMFRGCSSLIELDLSNFNLLNINDMSYMFFSCKSLTTLNIKQFKSNNEPDMSWIFNKLNPQCKIICDDQNILNLKDDD